MMQVLSAILDGVEADSPGVLGQRRRAAAEYVRAHGLPQLSDETWKYTSLATLRDIAYRTATQLDAQSISAEDFAPFARGLETPHRAVLVNGHFRADLSTLGQLPSGCSRTRRMRRP
jgi:Fe-S cluster assembly protein SufD